MNEQQRADHHAQLAAALGNTPTIVLGGEIGNTYVQNDERFVVSLIVGYGSDRDEVTNHYQAAEHALDLTRDDSSFGTHWYVFDRHTGILHLLRQGDFDPESDDRDPLAEGAA